VCLGVGLGVMCNLVSWLNEDKCWFHADLKALKGVVRVINGSMSVGKTRGGFSSDLEDF
jgi:hypothetical protein